MYVNDVKKEYVSGNFLIAGHENTATYPRITEMLQPESGVGAVILSLITPTCKKVDGSSVPHEFRGRWVGDYFYAMNNKVSNEKWKYIEANYSCLNLPGLDYLREFKGWDKPLYDTVCEDFHLPKPKKW
jgi:hypothetical protein